MNIVVWFLVYAFTGVVPYPYTSKADCERAATTAVVNPSPVYPQAFVGTNLPQVHQCVPAPLSYDLRPALALPQTIPQ